MKALLMKWLLTLAALAVAFLWLFFAQLKSVANDWLFADSPTGEPVLKDGDLATIRTVRFLPLSESIVKVAVSDLRVVDHGPGFANVTLTLTSNVATARYPSIKVFLLAGQKCVRSVVISPSAYTHQVRLTKEAVTLDLTLRSGETGFTASAFYGNSGA